jgi:hypothetical protein
MNRPANQDRWPHLSATAVLIAALTLAACAPADTTTTLTTASAAIPTSSATPTTASQEEEDAAIEIARLFLGAYRVSFDIDKAFSYLAADVEGVGPVAEELLLARFLQAIGTKTILGPCEGLSSGSNGTQVRCSFEDHMLRSDEIGLGPYGGSAFVLTVLDGQVTSFGMTFPPNQFSDPNGFSEQMWVPFASWVANTHPEDVAVMYENASQTGWRITEESIPLWEERSREYAQEIARERTAAVDVATAFVEAYAASDVAKAASYLTDNALAGFGGEVGGLGPGLRQGQAAGFKLLFEPCEAQDSSPPGTSVRCPYDYHGIRSDEIGLGPYSGSWFDITVLEGEIASVSDNIVFLENGFSDQMWEPFAAWVAANYPEDGAIMYENWPSIFMAQFTEESIALWAQRSREYVEVVLSS